MRHIDHDLGHDHDRDIFTVPKGAVSIAAATTPCPASHPTAFTVPKGAVSIAASRRNRHPYRRRKLHRSERSGLNCGLPGFTFALADTNGASPFRKERSQLRPLWGRVRVLSGLASPFRKERSQLRRPAGTGTDNDPEFCFTVPKGAVSIAALRWCGTRNQPRHLHRSERSGLNCGPMSP